jgi:hypothetical protein
MCQRANYMSGHMHQVAAHATINAHHFSMISGQVNNDEWCCTLQAVKDHVEPGLLG